MENKRNKGPNTYMLKALYKIEDYNKELDKLKMKYGKEEFEKAKTQATIIFSERDLTTIQEILDLTKLHGKEKVNYAFNKISSRPPNSSKRSRAYIQGILRSEQN